MPRKIEEQKTDNSSSWNIDEPLVREKIKEFEKELGERSFAQYCYDMGFVLERSRYWPKGTVVKNKLQEYQQAREKNAALKRLRERRYYAQKEAHKELIAPEKVCGNEEQNRCTYCYPYSLREYLVAHNETDRIEKYDNLIKKHG